jgi:hypothetical protein
MRIGCSRAVGWGYRGVVRCGGLVLGLGLDGVVVAGEAGVDGLGLPMEVAGFGRSLADAACCRGGFGVVEYVGGWMVGAGVGVVDYQGGMAAPRREGGHLWVGDGVG